MNNTFYDYVDYAALFAPRDSDYTDIDEYADEEELQAWCKSEFADSEYEDISVMMGWA